MNQCALVAQTVLVIADADDYHLRMILQASDVFFGRSTKLEREELDVCLDAGDERHSHRREDRIEFGTRSLWLAVEGLIDIVIYDIALSWHKLFRHLSTYINIVGLGILILTNRTLAIDTVADDYRHLSATDIAHSLGFPASRVQPVERRTSRSRNHQLPLFLSDIIHQMAGYRNLSRRFLAQTYSHGITDAISQKRTDAHGTLDSSIFTFAGFGNAQVKRVVHSFLLHLIH